MKPLSAMPDTEARGLTGLLFDLDDTVLDHGTLTLAAYDALWKLKEGGLTLVAVTGRPSGWGEVVARQWPIAGCVAENGAVHVVRDSAGVTTVDANAPERRERRERLSRLVARVHDALPQARLADDVHARTTDVTWDVGERRLLPEPDVQAIVHIIEEAGARWSRSSVHLHASFDVDDKASGALRFCARQLGVDPGSAVTRFAFVGDSGNDA
jgi:hypothetical protein